MVDNENNVVYMVDDASDETGQLVEEYFLARH